MKVMQAIETVLTHGCGVTLAQVLGSKRYSRLHTETCALDEHYPADSDLGIALRTGHLEFGRLMNSLDEREAIRRAQSTAPIHGLGHGRELRPLIRLTGEHLIKAAGKCLTADLRTLAKSWKSSSPDEQIEIARKLYVNLQSTTQSLEVVMTMESVAKQVRAHNESNRHHIDKVLPRRYGRWDPDSCVANCQGKTQMTIAFARLAGARAVTVHPLISSYEVLEKARMTINDMIVSDLDKRKLVHLDDGFHESLRSFVYDSMYHRNERSFHVGAALEISDGRWVLIDPHALNFGVFSDAHDIPGVVRRLDRYADVLPGMNLSTGNLNAPQAFSERASTRAKELLERSYRTEMQLASARNLLEAARILLDTGEIWFLAEYVGGLERKHIDMLRSNPVLAEYTAVLLFTGRSDPFEATMMFLVDPEFLTKRKHVLLTGYHALAMNEFRNQWTDDGTLVHPACELGLPEYSIAISAINSAVEQPCSETHRFLVDYSFDQTSLFNAISELITIWRPKEARDEVIGIAAANALRALPIRHPLCEQRMRLFSI